MPKSATASVSVCFPAYNEARSIERVLLDASARLRASGIDYEILVCDDASTDGTWDIIDRIATEMPRLRRFRHQVNQGIFVTFERLYGEATKEFVFLNSTDGQWDTAILFDLLPMTASADIIIASRQRKHYGWDRSLVSWAFNAVPKALFGVTTFDAGAVKLVRRELIAKWRLVSRSPFAEAERLIRAQRGGYRIIEHRVETAPRAHGRSGGARWRLITRSAVDAIRVRLALWREPKSRAHS